MSDNRCDPVSPHQTRRIGPTRRSVSGVYMFRRETPIPFESTLERDFLIRAEFMLDILDVTPQPVRIPFTDAQGRPNIYTPDYLVHYRLGDRSYDDYPRPLLVEVKPAEAWQTNWRIWASKWKIARQFARAQGWQFQIQDESRIRDQTFQNIRFLERFQRMHFASEESQWIVGNLRQMGSTTFHYLLARHFMGAYRANGVAHIWHLLANRRIDCDMSRPLCDQTELWVSDHAR
ncbi:heteromeric transposase endonuclease subunit TnsA [Paraburkholderia denitrificans]|uniref:Heteromeric transposase endonuclease subunit TnsA n=1 Tax=Paraburkholderia denitrificans TaxID=694025 RepID=A0ABW0J8T2_9BURK